MDNQCVKIEPAEVFQLRFKHSRRNIISTGKYLRLERISHLLFTYKNQYSNHNRPLSGFKLFVFYQLLRSFSVCNVGRWAAFVGMLHTDTWLAADVIQPNFPSEDYTPQQHCRTDQGSVQKFSSAHFPRRTIEKGPDDFRDRRRICALLLLHRQNFFTQSPDTNDNDGHGKHTRTALFSHKIFASDGKSPFLYGRILNSDAPSADKFPEFNFKFFLSHMHTRRPP